MIDKSKIQLGAYKSLATLKPADAEKLATESIAKAFTASGLDYASFEIKVISDDNAYSYLSWIFNYCAYSAGIITVPVGDNRTASDLRSNYSEAKSYFASWAGTSSKKKARLIEIDGLL